MEYCKRCVYPEIAVNIVFDDEGICSACRVAEEFEKLTPAFWTEREQKFLDLVESYRRPEQDNYDCIIAVSGGKDSYWQTYLIKEVYGLNPLLVTYHGNNYLPEGQGDLDRMREVFGVDHMVFGPSVDTLKKLNRLCYKKMGDMNWHAHAGIKIVPIIAAVKFNIPLVVWGETTWSIAGMFSPDDYVEYNKRTVLEHDLRGYNWQDMVESTEGIEPRDLVWLRFPTDEQIAEVGVRGIYIGNFFKWDPNEHAALMHEKYRFEYARQPFARTYRTMSNLDDMHENGIHDYMKFVKFGYGRASDHASKDIRLGAMTREEGIECVRRYESVKPRVDLERWLGYVGMSEQEFDQIADSFRDPRVWRKENGAWVKDNIWDEEPRRVIDRLGFSEAEIRPPQLMAEKEACLQADVDYLVSRKAEWAEVGCPACGSSRRTPFATKAGFDYSECSICGTVYTCPRPSQAVLTDFYANSLNYAYWNQHIFPATEGVRRERIFAPRADRVVEICAAQETTFGTLLEVGAAFGLFCDEIRNKGLFDRVIALEPTPDLAETCRSRRLEVLEMPIEELDDIAFADVVVAFEVIEHLFAPADFIRRSYELLRPGGLLVLTCPNVRGFDVATLGVLSNTFDHEHLNYFHIESLPDALARHGFEVVATATPGRLDADIVHKHVQRGDVDLGDQPFLGEVFGQRWDELGEPFQDFLAANRLSSHMWVVGRKPHQAAHRER